MQPRRPLTAAQRKTLEALAREPAIRRTTSKEWRWMVAGMPRSGPVDRLILRGLAQVEGDQVHISRLGRDVLASAD